VFLWSIIMTAIIIILIILKQAYISGKRL
jgi:hypothetical protein